LPADYDFAGTQALAPKKRDLKPEYPKRTGGFWRVGGKQGGFSGECPDTRLRVIQKQGRLPMGVTPKKEASDAKGAKGKREGERSYTRNVQ